MLLIELDKLLNNATRTYIDSFINISSWCAFKKRKRNLVTLIQRASEADSQSCSIEISDIYIFNCHTTSNNCFE